MNYINFCLIIFQIWCIYKYTKKLKETDERFKENEIDYFDIKNEIGNLKNKINELYIMKNEERS